MVRPEAALLLAGSLVACRRLKRRSVLRKRPVTNVLRVNVQRSGSETVDGWLELLPCERPFLLRKPRVESRIVGREGDVHKHLRTTGRFKGINEPLPNGLVHIEKGPNLAAQADGRRASGRMRWWLRHWWRWRRTRPSKPVEPHFGEIQEAPRTRKDQRDKLTHFAARDHERLWRPCGGVDDCAARSGRSMLACSVPNPEFEVTEPLLSHLWSVLNPHVPHSGC